ncbi:hypothetical protein A0H81_07255 [Grifola frondosa]|uniref:Uncharacterized protein n=1 Tax=Grifola frondosa TaxID=5627 RepID=A0A1C7M991_GRIFR|nr:hypothetical protein A0H81_07255 [Grifola frondosa]
MMRCGWSLCVARIHDCRSVHRDRSAPHDAPNAALPPGTRRNTSAPPLAAQGRLRLRHALSCPRWAHAPQAAAALALTLPKPRSSLLDSCVGMPSAEGIDGVFETPISQLADLVEGHKMSSFALCPASFYHELTAAGAQHVLEHLARMPADAVLDLAGITYSTCSSTLRLSAPASARILQAANANRTAQASSTSEAARSARRSLRSRARWSSGQQAMLDSHAAEMFYMCTAYELVFSRIVAYSPIFHSMKPITIQAMG